MYNTQDIISMSVGLLYFIPLILFIFTNNSFHLKAFIGLLGTNIISETIKHNFIKNISTRPFGAKNCDLLCVDGDQTGKPGMPSSHSAIVVFFASFYYQYTDNLFIKNLLIVYAIFVMLSRYLKRCHTIIQIVTGAILGLIISVSLLYY
jgi:membrane-associated phospholipid phosphatase